jgi:peptidoglycan/LPS O-acetylase OafA/YrhL
VKLGVYSYFIYLMHFVIIRVVVTYTGGNPFVVFAIALALSVGYAVIVDRFVDPYLLPRAPAPSSWGEHRLTRISNQNPAGSRNRRSSRSGRSRQYCDLIQERSQFAALRAHVFGRPL